MKELENLSNEDVQRAIADDPLVKAVLSAVPDQDRDRIMAYVMDFVAGWKSGAVDPIIAMASDPEFVKAFMKAMTDRDPGAGDLGGVM